MSRKSGPGTLTFLIAVAIGGCGGSSPSAKVDAAIVPVTQPDSAPAVDQRIPPADGGTIEAMVDSRPADAAAPSDTSAAPDGASTTPDAQAAADTGPDVAPAAACAPPADINLPVAKLSATGCVDPADPRKLAAVVVPYELNSPLWSDGAVKTRGMVVPAGKKIHVKNCATEPAACTGPADDGKWVFPVGTVMVKNFLFDEKLVETRLFVRADTATWVGYSYQWNEAQTDATIVPDERVDVAFNTGKRTVSWTFPSRIDCMKCHMASGGSTLGPETAQLNRVVGGMNQLDRLEALGLFDAPIPKPHKPALVAPYASESGAPPAGATLEQRALSYLHANCAFCHRPDAPFPYYDLRYDVAFKDRKICNAMPMKGDMGVPGSMVVKPGSAKDSVLWLRMGALPLQGRMPPLASKVVDQEAVKLIGDWIGSVTACPM
jgi:uncharacterized repeat protein (TIGR03806 family)